MKGSQPLTIVWDTFIQIENHLKNKGRLTAVKVSDTLTVDSQQLGKLLDQSLCILGIANSQMVIHCKEILRQFLNKDFKKICKRHVPFNQWMFGSNLKALLEDTVHVSCLVQQNKSPSVQATTKSFSCRREGQMTSRGGNSTRARYHSQRGRGLGRGWQHPVSIPQQQSSSQTGVNQTKPQTKRS